jgi:uncharacterized protein YegL
MSDKKKISIVGLLLDMTGSMAPHTAKTIDAVNEYVLGLKNGVVGDARLVLAVFNSDVKFDILSNTDVTKASGIGYETYRPSHTTPLYDAMSEMISHIAMLEEKYKGMSYDEVRVIITTLTDGYENTSTEISLDNLKEIVESKKEENWEFVFLGANIDSFSAGGAMGLSLGSTTNFEMSDISTAMRGLAAHTVMATNVESYTSGEFFGDKEDTH